MANDIPANWYPDAHGTIRWWDGEHWTNYVRGEAAGAPAASVEPEAQGESVAEGMSQGVSATAPEAVSATATEAVSATATEAVSATAPESVSEAASETSVVPSHLASTAVASTASMGSTQTLATRPTVSYPRSAPSTVTSRVIYPVNPEADLDEPEEEHSDTRRIVLTATAVGLAAFFLGMGIGGRNQAPQALPSPEPTPVIVTDSPELDQREADLDERESQLNDREDELDKRQTDLDSRKAELDRRALETPTPTPTGNATATRIGGEDTVLVGTDVRSGTYRTTGPSDPGIECEYTISRDSSGLDVVDDGQTSTAATVSLRDGEYFDSDDCQDWTRE